MLASNLTKPTSAKPLASNGKKHDSILNWDTAECLGEFHELVQHPPMHSVVVHIEPEAAEQLLIVTNSKNRPMSRSFAKRLGNLIEAEEYAITGDTIKFSKSGTLLDGQHRLQGCVNSKRAIISHMVFGLDDDIFDVLDQGHKRTAGDILALCGVEEYTLTAASIAWVHTLRNGRTSNASGLTPRAIRVLATGEMSDIARYLRDARLISSAFKHPPSLLAAILYIIGQKSEALAKSFAHEWVHGPRIGRNENFDVLSGRFLAVQRQGGGHINRWVRAALIVQTFNHWNADEVASPRSLTWRKEWKFPEFEFNAASFRKRRGEAEQEDTRLTASQVRLLAVMTNSIGDDGLVRLSHADLATSANVPRGSLSYLIGTLLNEGAIEIAEERIGTSPAAYRIDGKSLDRLKAKAA